MSSYLVSCLSLLKGLSNRVSHTGVRLVSDLAPDIGGRENESRRIKFRRSNAAAYKAK